MNVLYTLSVFAKNLSAMALWFRNDYRGIEKNAEMAEKNQVE